MKRAKSFNRGQKHETNSCFDDPQEELQQKLVPILQRATQLNSKFLGNQNQRMFSQMQNMFHSLIAHRSKDEFQLSGYKDTKQEERNIEDKSNLNQELQNLEQWTYLNSSHVKLKRIDNLDQVSTYVRKATQEMQKRQLNQQLEKETAENKWKKMRYDLCPRVDCKQIDKLLKTVQQKPVEMKQSPEQMRNTFLDSIKQAEKNSLHSKQNKINRRIYQDLVLKKIQHTQKSSSVSSANKNSLVQNIRVITQQTLSEFSAFKKNYSLLLPYINSDNIQMKLEKKMKNQENNKRQSSVNSSGVNYQIKNDNQQNTENLENLNDMNVDDYTYFKNNYSKIISNISAKLLQNMIFQFTFLRFKESNKNIEEFENELLTLRNIKNQVSKQIENSQLQLNEAISLSIKKLKQREQKFRSDIKFHLEKHQIKYDGLFQKKLVQIDSKNQNNLKIQQEVDIDDIICKYSDSSKLTEKEKEYNQISEYSKQYQKDCEVIKQETEQFKKKKHFEVQKCQAELIEIEEQLSKQNIKLKTLKQEKKNIKSIFKEYIRKALLDKHFLEINTQRNGLNYLLSQFSKLELNVTENQFPSVLSQSEKNYIYESYQILYRIDKLIIEIDQDLAPQQSDSKQFTTSYKFKLISEETQSCLEHNKSENMFSQLSEQNQNYIQTQEQHFQNNFSNKAQVTKHLSHLIKSQFSEINSLEEQYTNLKTSYLTLMKKKLLHNLQHKQDLKIFKQKLILLFGRKATEKIISEIIEKVKIIEVQEKTKILSDTNEEYSQQATNKLILLKVLQWNEEKRSQLTNKFHKKSYF